MKPEPINDYDRYAHIPEELKSYDQWVVWKSRPKDNGKTDKIPYSPITGKYAAVDNPQTWGTYEQAVNAYKNGNGYAGVGFVFTENDPLCGMDLDECIDAGGNIAEWADAIIRFTGSYAEISPSERGVKIFTKADFSERGRRRGNIEIYSSGRFFTVTGNHLENTPLTIESKTEEVKIVYKKHIDKQEYPRSDPACGVVDMSDDELIEAIRKSKAGAKFERLWAGDWAGYPSQSEADQALCDMLAWWTNKDVARMESLFIQSGLYRKKTDRRDSRFGTYLKRCIDKAIVGVTGGYTGKQVQEEKHSKKSFQVSDKGIEEKKVKLPEVYTANQLVNTDFPEPKWIIPDILCEGAALLCGPPKLGKSWMCLSWGISIASGGQVMGNRLVEQGEVLYLAMEDNPRRLKKRLTKLLTGNDPPDGFHIVTEWPKFDDGGLIFLDSWLNNHPQCRLVIVDTLAKVRNRSKTNATLYDNDYEAVSGLKRIADEHEIAVVIVHHVNKTKPNDILETVSGTTGLTGAADSILILARERGKSDGTLFITGRDVEEQDLALSFDQQKCMWEILGDADEYRISLCKQDVLTVFKNSEWPVTPKEVAKEIGKSENAAKNIIYSLVDENKILRVGHGRYIFNKNTN